MRMSINEEESHLQGLQADVCTRPPSFSVQWEVRTCTPCVRGHGKEGSWYEQRRAEAAAGQRRDGGVEAHLKDWLATLGPGLFWPHFAWCVTLANRTPFGATEIGSFRA